MTLIERRTFIRKAFFATATAFVSLPVLNSCVNKGVQNVMSTTNNEITLEEFHIEHKSDGLQVAYTIRNNSGGDIGIFNRIPLVKSDGTAENSLLPAYIDLDGSELHLRAMELPLPGDGIQVAIKIVPYATLVKNKNSFREKFFLPAPIVVINPYKQITLAAANPGKDVVAGDLQQADEVKLSVGVFKSRDELKFIPVASEQPEVYRIYPATYQQIVLTQSVSLNAPIPVKDYHTIAKTKS